MNAERRKRIEKIRASLDEANLEIISVRDDEQDAFDNLPESIQQGEKGQESERTIDEMENALTALGEAYDSLGECL